MSLLLYDLIQDNTLSIIFREKLVMLVLLEGKDLVGILETLDPKALRDLKEPEDHL